MYDELIKSLRICADQGKCNGCKYDEIDIPSCHNPLMREAADAIEDLQAQLMFSNDAAKTIAEKVPRWIPVTERLPEENGHYLVHAVGNGYYSTYIALWNGRFRANFEMPITHWMPLPEPPESGEA